ncbi:MAG: ion channel [Candidatus Cloacimonetes bacterium]|nr:ion channel [Candidatus Cloacimonadota bacterium]MDD3533004.1 ion channel [Candidatus Cloacimonadota bacterium]
MGKGANPLIRKLRKKALYHNLSVENQKLVLRFLLVCAFIAVLLLISALLIWLLESRGSTDSTIESFWDGIWWAVVTIATVGYGDKFPVTFLGRLVGMILIVIGFASLSVFTGLIASLFVEDRLKGAKGLKQVRTHHHVVLCGWNNTAHYFLGALIDKKMESTEVCLLMNETPEFFESLESQYPSLALSFVRGEPTSEDTLRRAAVSNADQVIILADHSLQPSIADDRSIIVANAIHFLTKKEKITVQLINHENKQMLQRIGINKIFIWDDLGGYLLAENIMDTNNLSIYTQLVKNTESRIRSCEISDDFCGKEFGELYDHIYQEEGRIVIGLMTQEPELKLDSIFDDNSSAIDQFIKTTLSKSKKIFSGNKSSIRFNPPRQSIIQESDQAIILQ